MADLQPPKDSHWVWRNLQKKEPKNTVMPRWAQNWQLAMVSKGAKQQTPGRKHSSKAKSEESRMVPATQLNERR